MDKPCFIRRDREIFEGYVNEDSVGHSLNRETMIIPYQRFEFTIEAIDELNLPYYKGSTFRGGFGMAFKRIVCALKRQDCGDCMLKSKCIYAYVFETSPVASSSEGPEIMNMHKYEKIPHPFVIEPPETNSKTCNSGDSLNFNLLLIGRAVDYLPYFIYTFDELGRTGIGKGRGRYRLVEVRRLKTRAIVYSGDDRIIRQSDVDTIEIPDDLKPEELLGSLSIRFITPLRIKYNRDLVVRPEFHILIRNLLRRLGLLYYFHCGNKKPKWDHKTIINHATEIEIKSSSLKWLDWERYSSRQDSRMRLGGLIGEITYYGDIKPFLPLLRAGEILHAGKNTSFGLGRYEII